MKASKKSLEAAAWAVTLKFGLNGLNNDICEPHITLLSFIGMFVGVCEFMDSIKLFKNQKILS